MNAKHLPGLLSVVTALAIGGGCASQTPVPALLDPTQLESAQPETTQALTVAASRLLDGRRITLGSRAFVTRSRVSLEHSLRNTPKGRLATGRTLAVPEELQLVRIGRRCELAHSTSQQRITLPGITCIDEPLAATD